MLWLLSTDWHIRCCLSDTGHQPMPAKENIMTRPFRILPIHQTLTCVALAAFASLATVAGTLGAMVS